MNEKFKGKAKRLISGFVAAATVITMLPAIPAMAEELGRYPYTLFAGSSSEGAITTTASNFGVNGNVATNGTISAAGNMNINGTKTENAGLDMIYILDKIDSKYFSGSDVEEHTEDYVLDELNINISEPTEVLGEAELTGNININTALKAFKDVTLNGEVKNTNDSVIYSKYGDIVIDSTNVNLNGLVYFDEYLGDNNQRCGIDDLNADADAVNISHEILSRDFTSLNNVLTQYYTSGISMRYTAFIKTALNDSEETIEPYTKTHYVFFRWPILHDNVKISSDESKKIKTSFWDYLNKLKALEER